MKHKLLKFGITILAIIAFSACDTIKKPYLEENGGKCGNGNLSIPIKKVLLEDYTGHTCGNCPRAAEQTEFLVETYCDHVIPISVHAGFFAEPWASEKYTYDFRTDIGNDWDDFFGNSSAGLPNGMLNRTEYNGTKVLAHETWASALEQLLNETPLIDIKIKNSYNIDTRELKSSVDINFLKNISGTLNLSVLIVEDSIVNWQKDYNYEDLENPGNTDVENYIHRHVLRGAVNGTWGETIVEQTIQQGKSINKSFTYELNQDWFARHCSVVMFVYYTNSKEIIQAELTEI
jgi:hypothetical protein